MKIIKEGSLPVYSEICPRCNCEFEYDERDMEQKFSKNHFVKCPWCSVTISRENVGEKPYEHVYIMREPMK